MDVMPRLVDYKVSILLFARCFKSSNTSPTETLLNSNSSGRLYGVFTTWSTNKYWVGAGVYIEETQTKMCFKLPEEYNIFQVKITAIIIYMIKILPRALDDIFTT